MSVKNNKGAILITTLWIVTILTALCVSAAHRSAIVLKLSSYQIDKIKSHLIANAGVQSALAVKAAEYERGVSLTIDALSEPWASRPEIFNNHTFSDGVYTLAYSVPGEKNILYGLTDESSRIDINKASPQVLSRLIISCGVEEAQVEEIAYAIVDWRDEDNSIGQNTESELMLGAEDEYYQSLPQPYHCKNSSFEIPEELLLVKGVTPGLFYGNKGKDGKISAGLKDFVTVYTDGKLNINTAPELILAALFGIDFEQLPEKIAIFRRGSDEVIGTQDDRWFSTGAYIVERGEEGMVEVKNLSDGDWLGNTYGVTTQEYNKIKELMQAATGVKLVTSSNVYRALAQGEIRKVKTSIEAVYEFQQGKQAPVVKFWRQQ